MKICFLFSYSAYGYQTANPASYNDHLQSYYQALSANHISSLSSSVAGNTTGPTPPPPDLQPIVDKTAEYVARNSDGFERTVLEKHCGDSRFSFLNPWDQYHAYYQMKKQQFQEKGEQDDKELKEKSNIQKLNSSGAVSFKLQMKNSKLLAPKVDLSVGGEDEDEYGEGQEEGERGQNEIVNNGLEDKVEPPPAKRRRGEEEDEEEEEEEEEGDKIGCKVQVLYCVLVCLYFIQDKFVRRLESVCGCVKKAIVFYFSSLLPAGVSQYCQSNVWDRLAISYKFCPYIIVLVYMYIVNAFDIFCIQVCYEPILGLLP